MQTLAHRGERAALPIAAIEHDQDPAGISKMRGHLGTKQLLVRHFPEVKQNVCEELCVRGLKRLDGIPMAAHCGEVLGCE